MVYQPTIEPKTRDDLAATLLAALGVAIGFAGLAYLCVEIPRVYGHVTPIWLSNGFLAACLLSSPSRRWPALVVGGLVGALAAGAHAGDSPTINAILVTLNVSEALLAAVAVRRVAGQAIDLGRPRDMLAFVLLGGFLAPLIAGGVASSIHTFVRGGDLLTNVTGWVLNDILGMLTIGPCLLVLFRAKLYLREQPLTRDGMLSILACGVMTAVVFGQTKYPLLFLVPPVILLAAWRQEVLGAVLGGVLVAAIALVLTIAGRGPIHLILSGSATQSTVLQLFLAVSTFVALPVAAFQRQRRAIMAELVETSAAAERSEAKFRLLAESALDIIAHSDLHGQMTYISPAARSIMGYPPEELLGVGYLKTLHPDDLAKISEVVRVQRECSDPALAPPAATVEYRAFRKDGDMIWLESRPTLAFDPLTSVPNGITDIIRDVTARKTLEMDLRAARAEAEAAAAVKGEFLANMSHELRTPLTAVIGFANLAAEEADLSPRARRYLDRIAAGGQTLLTTINDILDFSRLEAGRIALNVRPTNVADLVAEVLELTSAGAMAKGLTLGADGLAALPAQVMIDPERVRQVLVNLVGNAVKFTDAGKVSLAVVHQENRLRIAVVDTGRGVAAEDQALLFARFSQIDAALNRQHGGTGLGLAISRGLVELMGGEIGVESEEGKGARFWFEIPADVAQTDDKASDEDDLPLPPPGSRVLVVDDNAGNRELVRSVLEAVGVEVAEARDGEEGVAAAAAETYDAILMDLRMPRLDGVSAAQRIRAEQGPSSGAPIIAFSADVRLGPLDPVFDGATPKPLTVMSLLSTLAQAMSGPAPVTA
ncbi:MASE1 domain-containing protein [Caulobacter sp. 602-1]|uniref:MASE1 domain-containing protein n=1 Tax=Caulobacter sp. 602-1 TaxID=2492472 RepID=UPI000F637DDD|nr:MASE1 domain-containing protein [Caulobacter sp. 602-1]RRN64135.1 PAS domain S-box protein [Caulobacter sp. 602-1]